MTNGSDKETRSFVFTLIAHGLSDWDEVDANAVFAAGCDDCSPGSRDGRVDFIFDRDAASLEAAIGSAVLDLKKAGISAWLESVESPEQDQASEADDARAAM